MKQRQFLEVIDEETAHARFAAAFARVERRKESVPLEAARGRILAREVRALVDVPGFDRSNVDGFAVASRDTYGASELEPRFVRPLSKTAVAGPVERGRSLAIQSGTCIAIATGAPVPRGADAVVMVEDTAVAPDGSIEIHRAVAPGSNISGAGSDMGRGDVVLFRGEVMTSRETGLAAAVGVASVDVWARPQVAVISTGDEVRPPGTSLAVGEVFDSNSRIICDALEECGADARFMGIVGDDAEALERALQSIVLSADAVVLSGGTSKGTGDLNHEVLRRLARRYARPGSNTDRLLVHGVALKPGKPLCLAVVGETPVVVLPGFPTSAIFTFQEFMAPHVRRLAGLPATDSESIAAVAPVRFNSSIGRTEYVLVQLVPGQEGLAAYPLGSGSGSVSTYSRADGFVRVDRRTEYIAKGERLQVRPLGQSSRPADLIVIGSHCLGLDLVLARLADEGVRSRSVVVGSLGGLAALRRGEGDVAGCHLLDADTGTYNRPFLDENMSIVAGYGRRQGIVFKRGDARFENKTLEEIRDVVGRAGVRMVNRNRGSGTRIVVDRFLGEAIRPNGYDTQARSHNAVAAAVAQGRADWGIAIDVVARDCDLGFIELAEERFELVIRSDRPMRRGLRRLIAAFDDEAICSELRRAGFLL